MNNFDYDLNGMPHLSSISLVLINFYLGERLALTTVVGALLIIGGILVSNGRRAGKRDAQG